ncbi:MAG: cytochrome c biogenesis protein ResB [Myxococcales bacterium]|nr:MAG: cytochrome c biogenesis protein ResB [Myxococcales bacterium]
MVEKKTASSLSERIWRLFVSVKFTVALLIVWLILSVIGTVILQNGRPEQYVELYGPQWSNFLQRFGMFDVYHSTGYILVLVLLSLNLIACSFNSLKSRMALAIDGPKRRAVQGDGKQFATRSFAMDDESAATEKLAAALRAKFGRVDVFEENGEKRLFAHKQAFSHFMVYVVHSGLLVIIIGGLVSAAFGFEGYMEIPEGRARDFVFKKLGSDYIRTPIGFTVRCDTFEFQRFSGGMVKDYVSNLTVVDGGQEMLKKRIEVNDPLSYGGFNFYQSSYVEQVGIALVDQATGRRGATVLSSGEEASVIQLGASVRLEMFSPPSPEAKMTAYVTVTPSSGESYRAMLSSDPEANRAGQAGRPILAEFSQARPVYSTGLMVVSDPGAIWIWIGSALMIAGMYLTFYTAHRRVAVSIASGRVQLNAHTTRNAPAFQREIDAILHRAGFAETASESNKRKG